MRGKLRFTKNYVQTCVTYHGTQESNNSGLQDVSQFVEPKGKCENITSVDHKDVTCYGLRGRGVESRSLMTSVETRDLSGKADRFRVKNNTKRVGKSRHVDGEMFTTVEIFNEKSLDP